MLACAASMPVETVTAMAVVLVAVELRGHRKQITDATLSSRVADYAASPPGVAP